MEDRSVQYVVKEALAPRTEAAKAALLALLPTITIPPLRVPSTATVQSGRYAGTLNKTRGMKIGTIGRTCTFGFGRTRRGFVEFVRNARHPEVYKALIEYGRCVVPTGFFFNTITLNKGVQALKHIDGLNVGMSIIVSFGVHTGGKLRVYSTDTEFEAMDIHDKPLMFNGSLLAHETEPFEGERWSIVFYKQRDDPLPGHETTGL
jgi:hypothetical protein